MKTYQAIINKLLIKSIYLKWLVFIYLFALSPVTQAHVGSSGVIVQKQVGKYHVLVSIQPPDVVPGTARVSVFFEQGRVSTVSARPIYYNAGDKGAPIHDTLRLMPDGQYTGDVWLMESGSSSIELSLGGPDGNQQIIIPVMAQATALREMPTGTGIGLAAMGLLLLVMLVTIIGASNADALVLPERSIPVTLRRRRWQGMYIGLILITLALTGWRFWWNKQSTIYKDEQLYQSTPIHASVQVRNAQHQLTIQFDTAGSNRRSQRTLSYLIPDHGKLMHTFLVRMPGLDAFAHLHPNRRDTLHYEATVPALPDGKYLLYTDVVYRNGFAETLTDTVEVPALKIRDEMTVPVNSSDSDDSGIITQSIGVKAGAVNAPRLDKDIVACGKPSVSAKLVNNKFIVPANHPGSYLPALTLFWMDKPTPVLESGKVYVLKFAVADSAGKPVSIEPYMGMSGHAVVLRSDGTVYIHLHPVGTYSVAAEGSLASRIIDTARTVSYPEVAYFRDSIDRYITTLKSLPEAKKNQLLTATMSGMSHSMKTNNMVEFPYAFPRAGQYRIWVQIKYKGRILTGVFDTQVTNSPL